MIVLQNWLRPEMPGRRSLPRLRQLFSRQLAMLCLESLRGGLERVLEADHRVVLLGEDVLDPYGGAFKVTRGLSSAYQDRVYPTPISEAAIVGVCTCLALRGLRPVGEIMFGDFLTLCADQII